MTKQIPKVDPKFQKYLIDLGEGRSHIESFIIFTIISSSFRLILIKIANFFLLIYKIKIY